MKRWIIGIVRAIIALIFFLSLLMAILILNDADPQNENSYMAAIAWTIAIISFSVSFWFFKREKNSLRDWLLKSFALILLLIVSILGFAILGSSHHMSIASGLGYGIFFLFLVAIISSVFAPKS